MRIAFAPPEPVTAGAVMAGVFEDRKLSPSAAELDQQTEGALTRALGASKFKGKPDDLLAILAPSKLQASRIVLFGLGKPEALDAAAVQAIGGRLVSHLNSVGETQATVRLDAIADGKLGLPAMAAHLAHGARLRSYRFDKYRTKEKPEQKPTLDSLTILVEDPEAAQQAYAPLEKLGDAVVNVRNLVSEPANVIYPETLAGEAQKLAALGVNVEILDVAQMRELGMGALLGVGQGSAHEPRLVVMEWDGRPDGQREGQPLAFVGKGVTFDTGGISIKPAANMEDMKWDMAGSAAVIGLIQALAGRRAAVHAIGVIGLVENMPSGTAQRPGDIVTSMSGQTIEVINTDAEGRLVLADALWYTQERFNPQLIVDLATLTGAVIVALGNVHAGLYSNNEELADRLLKAGKAVGELLWRLPLAEPYDKMINSDAADMKNTGGRYGGSITAAQFLQRFIKEGRPWAHLDIAGMAWSDKDKPTTPKGATAFGVALLDRFVADHYEQREPAAQAAQ